MAKAIPPPPAETPKSLFTSAVDQLPRDRPSSTKRCTTCGAPGSEKCPRCAVVEEHLEGYVSTVVGRAKVMHAVRRAEQELTRRASRPSRPPPPPAKVETVVADEKHVVRRPTKGSP
jgi:hypothetical protein